LIELLRRAAAGLPEGAAVVGEQRTYRYADLAGWSEAIADAMVDQGIERFAVVTTDAAMAIALLAASSLVPAEACQYAGTDSPSDIAALLERFDHDVLVTDRTDLADLPARVLSVDDLAPFGATSASDRPVPDGPRPLLILTTGTTGQPRAARHDWHRSLRRLLRLEPRPGPRWLLAYGHHQFAGMHFVMNMLALGATVVTRRETRPKDALAAMRADAVTSVGATPTWWRFVLAELAAEGGPAPDLQQLTLGGEAVPDSLLEQLGTTFPNARITQIYGGNEFGTSGSVQDRRAGLPISVLERGEDADVQMKVVDDELWVRSRIGMLGYYGEEAVDPDAWRPTGDRVEIVGDRIMFRGRTTEIINVGGVKVSPVPVEEAIGVVPGVQLVRAFGRENRLTGAMVAAEVVAEPGIDTDELAGAIRAACADLPAAMRPRSIKFVEELAVRGGKINRRVAT
jgi:acyl-coenzyme A synthetase/AMP-(fatty) acid ligase